MVEELKGAIEMLWDVFELFCAFRSRTSAKLLGRVEVRSRSSLMAAQQSVSLRVLTFLSLF